MAVRVPETGSIRRLLIRARRRALAVRLGTGALLWLATVSLLGLAAALVAGFLEEGFPAWAVGAAWAGALGTGAWVVWRFGLSPARHLWPQTALALTVERAVPATAGLTSAVQFLEAEARGEGGALGSEELARAHVASVDHRTRETDPSPAFPVRPLGQASAVLALAVSLHLVAVLAAGDTVRRGYDRLVGDLVLPLAPEGPPGEATPITGDVELTYRYPAYTRLPARTVSGTGGAIRAPKGTEVEIRTLADRPVTRAELVVGDSSRPLTVGGDRRLSGRLVVGSGGAYRFRFLDGRGRVRVEGPPHPIEVVPDEAPEVTASVSGGEDPLEVRETDTVPVRWRALDDYGLGEVTLVWQVEGGRAQRKALETPSEAVRAEGTVAWDLSVLGLAPGDRVAWHVEGLDNDAVDGPKTGVSPTRYLKVFSAAEHHREVMAKVEAVWEAMLTRLADHLETPFEVQGGDLPEAADPAVTAAQGLNQGLSDLGSALDGVITELADDPLAPAEMGPALSNIRAGISRARARADQAVTALKTRMHLAGRVDRVYAELVRRSWRERVEELEKDVLYLEDLLDRQKVQDLVAMGEEIKAHKRRLAELIDQLREHPDEATRSAIGEEIARAKARIHELMAKMATLAKDIGDEHLNAQAMRELESSQDLLGGLDEVQRLLEEGDLDEALAELARMTDSLDAMLSSLEEEGNQFGGEEYAAVSEDLMEFMDGLSRIQKEQQALLQETDSLEGRYRQEVERRMKGSLDRLVAELSSKAAEARAGLETIPDSAFVGGLARFDQDARDAASGHLQDLQSLLEARDLSEAREVAQRALQQSGNLAASLKQQARDAADLERLLGRPQGELDEARKAAEAAAGTSEEIAQALEQLFPDPQEVFGRKERQRLSKLSERQDELRRQAVGLQQKMEEISRQAPVFSPGMEGELRQAGQHMDEAAQRLAGSDARNGTSQQRAALERLGQLEQQMREAARQGGGKGGVPLPMSQMAGGGAGQGFSQEKVEIPDQADSESGQAFRERLMEAMKEGAPERYAPQVRRYYEELVK